MDSNYKQKVTKGLVACNNDIDKIKYIFIVIHDLLTYNQIAEINVSIYGFFSQFRYKYISNLHSQCLN